MKSVKILGKTNLRPAQIDRLHTISDLEVFDSNVPDRSTAEVVSRAAGAEIILINAFTPVDADAVAALPGLRAIVSCSAGIDHVDLVACRKARVKVSWFPGYCARTLAEKTFSYILMGLNKIVPALDNVRSGRWDYLDFQARETSGRSIGITGYGATGKIVRQFCEPFGFAVMTADSKTAEDELARILSTADVVTLHMDLNPKTERFLRAETLRLLKADVVIVNTARGELVNDRDLVDFLSSHPRATAFLDVLAVEPAAPESAYRKLQNAFITPHIGWNSVESDGLLANSTEADSGWSPQEEMASMRNGSGDDYAMVFSPAGVFARGYDHESPLSRAPRPWPGVVDSVPESLVAQVTEPAFCHPDGTPRMTVCFWREVHDDAWRCGDVALPTGRGADADGADRLFGLLADGRPEAYREFAEDYYGTEVDLDAVRRVYALHPLTVDLVARLNPETSLRDLADDQAEIGYPLEG